MNPNHPDVLVIGGGPAGLSTAIHLSQQGARVLVAEAKRYPHNKMCGEFLSPECAGLLDRLGMRTALFNLQPVAINTAKITAPDGSEWQSTLPRTAFGLSRRALDASMAERARLAGVQVLEETNVLSVEGSLENGFVALARREQNDCTFHARLVIAAHGKRAALDRTLDRQFLRKRQPYMALKAHFDGPAIPDRIELHGFPGGYCGLSEVEDGGRVACLLVHERVFQAVAGEQGYGIEHFIAWMQTQNSHLGSWFAQAERTYPRWITISQVCFDQKTAIERDVLMAGDAAGLITPLAGNGIAMALQGGQMAAEAAMYYLKEDWSPDQLRRRYLAGWRKTFRMRLTLGRALQPLMLRPSALGLALRLMHTLPSAGLFLFEHTRGQPASSFEWEEKK